MSTYVHVRTYDRTHAYIVDSHVAAPLTGQNQNSVSGSYSGSSTCGALAD